MTVTHEKTQGKLPWKQEQPLPIDEDIEIIESDDELPVILSPDCHGDVNKLLVSTSPSLWRGLARSGSQREIAEQQADIMLHHTEVNFKTESPDALDIALSEVSPDPLSSNKHTQGSPPLLTVNHIKTEPEAEDCSAYSTPKHLYYGSSSSHSLHLQEIGRAHV